MTTTPISDAAANPSYCECDPGTVVNIRDARLLETKLASVQLELGATKGELEEANKDAERLAGILSLVLTEDWNGEEEPDHHRGPEIREALFTHEARIKTA